MPIICKTKDLSNDYRKKFEDFGVEIRPIIAGNITHQPFYRKYVTDVTPLPNSDFIHENGFYFGNNPELTNDEVNSLCTLLEK
jgi:CDP-6-deoxy-D-xylo-4-hexulose-3-dehydrase